MKPRLVLAGLVLAFAFMMSVNTTAQAADACNHVYQSGDELSCASHADGDRTCCVWSGDGSFVGCCTYTPAS